MQQISLIITIVCGVVAILAFIKNWGKDEKTNAVEIANIKKDIVAQDIAKQNLRDEMRREVGHLQSDVKEIKEKQDDMQETQHEMRSDIKLLVNHFKKP
jgi:hypothetical protein